MADYRINLIEPAAMSAADLDKLQSSLRAVLGFIKYSNNGEELDAFLANESSLHSLDVQAARVIRVCTNTNIEIDENTEVIDMCKAVQEMNEKARLEGERVGRLEGERKDRLETLSASIQNVMESFHVTADEALKVLKITSEDQMILKKMI